MDAQRTGILFVCESTGSINIARRIINQHDFHCPLYLFTPERFYLQEPSIVDDFDFFTTEPHTIPGLLAQIKLVLLGAHESTPHCKISNAIGFISKETKTAHASIQHGWIQPGLNFTTEIKRIGYRGLDTDNSRSLVHFSPPLNFFGDHGIGYPYPHDKLAKSKTEEHRIVIATNFNWGVYSKNDLDVFLDSIREIRNIFPSSKLVHRPHPAEKRETIEQDWAEAYKSCNISNANENHEYKKLHWPSLVVSTPSSIALDYITSNIPTILYAPKKFKSYINELSLECRSYCEINELSEVIHKKDFMEVANIPKFPSATFEGLITKLIKNNQNFKLTEEAFLKFSDLIAN